METPPDRGEITRLLRRWQDGDADALEPLMSHLYGELRRLADRVLSGERREHTLQPTALLHEAFMRLVEQRDVDWRGRAHFLAAAAGTMRRVLVDHARRRNAVKRSTSRRTISIDENWVAALDRPRLLVHLDDALDGFARLDPRRARVVELRFFGGLTVREIAEVLAVSPGTVKRDLSLARAWLFRELSSPEAT